MVYTLLFKILPDDTEIKKILIIGTAIYAIIHYLIYSNVITLPMLIQKYKIGFYGILILDLIIFLYLYNKEINETLSLIKENIKQIDDIDNKRRVEQELQYNNQIKLNNQMNNQVINPNNQVINPNNQVINPNNQVINPGNNQVINPNNQVINPNNQVINPNNQVITPKNNQIINPGNNQIITPKNNQVINPNNQIINPNNQIITPKNNQNEQEKSSENIIKDDDISIKIIPNNLQQDNKSEEIIVNQDDNDDDDDEEDGISINKN